MSTLKIDKEGLAILRIFAIGKKGDSLARDPITNKVVVIAAIPPVEVGDVVVVQFTSDPEVGSVIFAEKIQEVVVKEEKEFGRLFHYPLLFDVVFATREIAKRFMEHEIFPCALVDAAAHFADQDRRADAAKCEALRRIEEEDACVEGLGGGPAVRRCAELLRTHDWYYAFSDDPSVYQRGDDERKQLAEELKALPRETQKTLWACFAPETMPFWVIL